MRIPADPGSTKRARVIQIITIWSILRRLYRDGKQGDINIRNNFETSLQNPVVQNGDENCLGDHISAPTARTIRRRLDRKLSRANICLVGHVKRPNVFPLRHTDRIRRCQRI